MNNAVLQPAASVRVRRTTLIVLLCSGIAVYLLFQYGGFMGSDALEWLPWAGWTLFSALAGVRALVTAKRTTAREMRIAWLCFSAAVLLWGFGSVYVVFGLVVLPQFETYQSFGNVFFLAHGISFIAGLFYIGLPGTHATLTLVRLSNIGVIACLMLLCAILIVLAPMRESAEPISYMLYAIADIAIYLTATVLALTYSWANSDARMRPVVLLLGIAISVHLVSNLSFYYLTFSSGTSGSGIDVFWLVSLALMYWAAFEFDVLPASSQLREQNTAVPFWAVLQTILPAALLLGTLAVAVVFRENLTREFMLAAIPVLMLFAVFLGIREWAIVKHEKWLTQELRDSSSMNQHVLSVSQAVIFVCEIKPDYRIRHVSENSLTLFDLDLVGSDLMRLAHTDDEEAVKRALHQAAEKGESSIECRMRDRDGKFHWMDMRLTLTLDRHDQPLEIVGTMIEITEKKALQISMEQNQRLEALGRLSGSIAHDFNNLLTTILGSAELLLGGNLGTEERIDAEEIRAAGERGAGLTRQLLAFSHRHAFAVQTVDMNALINGMDSMLSRLIGDQVVIHYKLSEQPICVEANVSQLEQVVMNLVLNARDSIEDEGEITVAVEEAYFDQSSLYDEQQLGLCAMLVVSDTGSGIEEEALPNVFDPFFTTRKTGTGLGLATVHGIVMQHDGQISVVSEPGKGTQFKIFLPLSGSDEAVPADDSRQIQSGTETLLVVDDEVSITRVIAGICSRLGYTVMTANDAERAMALAREHKIDLLLTDIVMPGCNGPELRRRLLAVQPGMRTVYMSGYTDDLLAKEQREDRSILLLQKPLTVIKLTTTIRATLDSESWRHNIRQIG